MKVLQRITSAMISAVLAVSVAPLGVFADAVGEADKPVVKQVELGGYCSAVITEDGVLYTWGHNYYGQLGDGTTKDRYTPIKVMENVVSVSLGYHNLGLVHSAAITENGDLYTWGNNYYGQLGDGTTEDRHTPIKVMENVVSVSLGEGYSAAITENGDLYFWGWNGNGQLGNGTTEESFSPIKVMGGVVAVDLGYNHSAAITRNGDLYTWGSNNDGKLGDGTTEDRHTPTKIMENVVSVSLGELHSAAITGNGDLYTWGCNVLGRLGDDTIGVLQKTPTKIMGNIATVSLAPTKSAATTKNGDLYTWGDNSGGQLGDGTTEDRKTPTKVMENIASVRLGHSHSAAITENGELYTWGSNSYGQLGNGTQTNSTVPIKIDFFGANDAEDPIDTPEIDPLVLIQAHLDKLENNEYQFLNSKTSSILSGLESDINADTAVTTYGVLDALKEDILLKGALTSYAPEDMDEIFNQKITVQSILATILCSEENIEKMNDSYLNAADEASNTMLDTISLNSDVLEITQTDYDVEAELKKVLAIKDRSSDAFKKAKEDWFKNSMDSINMEKLSKYLEAAGYVVEIANMGIETAQDYYTFFTISQGYKAADAYMLKALSMMRDSMYANLYMYPDPRARAVVNEFGTYYALIADTSEDKYNTYLKSLIAEDFEEAATKVASEVTMKIVENVIKAACPELAAALKVLEITLDVGMFVWEEVSTVDERAITKDMFLNMLVFQDAIADAMTKSGGFADTLITNKDIESLMLFEYGFDLYKKIYILSLSFGRDYRLLQGEMMKKNAWLCRDMAYILSLEIEAIKAWECHDAIPLVEGYDKIKTQYEGYDVYYTACPVNIVIKNGDTAVAELGEEGVLYCTDDTLLLDVIHNTEEEYAYKFYVIPSSYDVEIVGFADGSMSFEKITYENGSTAAVSYAEAIPVSSGAVYTEVFEEELATAIEVDYENDGIADEIAAVLLVVQGTLGDLNDDTNIDASDAAMILVAAAAVGAGEDSGLTADQEAAADVDNDGTFNAIDAAYILQYAAAAGAGYTGSFADFLDESAA